MHDVLWVPITIMFAYWLRFNLGAIPSPQQVSLLQLIAIAVPVQAAFFWQSKLYRGLWRFASIPDLVRIVRAVGLGLLVIIFAASVTLRLEGIPRSVLLLYPILLTVGLCLPRISYRWYKDHRLKLSTEEGKNTLIFGAGWAGELLVRDLLHSSEYNPVAFIDDDTTKHNREILGIRVIGGLDCLVDSVRMLSIDLVLVAIPSADKKVIQRIFKECTEVGVPCKTLPSLDETAGSKIDADGLRPITVDDLLGRELVHLDHEAIAGYLYGKTVLVTGGGGSIGSELCRQMAYQKPDRLIIFEHSEFNLYSIEQEMRSKFPQLRLEIVLGDIKDIDRVDWVFRGFSPEVVFHAAAYKHVPMLEVNPVEGVQNNTLGTKNIADKSDEYHVKRFVLVSTDKAVNPANVMGATKRIAELYCQNLNSRSETRFITTRFGNVLGSAGSVVPLFQKQIEEGGPVTITHPEITRYFMTIPESVGLILQAGAMGKGGEIFVMDMGQPVRIKDLADQMIRLSGLDPDKDIEIIYTGLRPGEKLYEELLHETEGLQPTNHEKLLLARSREVDWGWLMGEMACLRRAATSRDIPELQTCLRNIVPEFRGTASIEVDTPLTKLLQN